MNEYKLPDVGEGLTEAEIVTWRVEVGDVVKVNDVVVEIETAKSLVELPSPYAGTVQALLVPEGQTVSVGTPLIRVGDATPDAPPAEPAPAAPAASAGSVRIDPSDAGATGNGQNQTLVGYGPREASASRRRRRGETAPGGRHRPGTEVPARALAKPPVRRLARDLGVDLAALVPTGPDGTVTREDVRAAVPSDETAAPVPGAASPGPRETRHAVRGVQRAMAQAMVSSAFTAPHVTEWVTLDVTRTTRLLGRLRAHRDFREVSVSPLLVVAKACLLALRRTPEVNASWDEANQEVVLKHYVNLGVAAATPRGLVVPNVKDADTLRLPELGHALNELARTAREGRTSPAELSGGTFTITNVGVFGVDAGTPIINPGESAILCLGAVRPRPWVHRGKVKVRDVTTLALSFDHRLVDGEQGSRFLADVAGVLEDPASALLA